MAISIKKAACKPYRPLRYWHANHIGLYLLFDIVFQFLHLFALLLDRGTFGPAAGSRQNWVGNLFQIFFHVGQGNFQSMTRQNQLVHGNQQRHRHTHQTGNEQTHAPKCIVYRQSPNTGNAEHDAEHSKQLHVAHHDDAPLQIVNLQ